jgi:hypothetical protein
MLKGLGNSGFMADNCFRKEKKKYVKTYGEELNSHKV